MRKCQFCSWCTPSSNDRATRGVHLSSSWTSASGNVLLFLLLVFFYILDLIKTLKLVSPAARKAQPKSVWLMFLLPYNFIEDFFIVANVAKSLEAEAAVNPALASFKSFGMVSGLGWCVAQIISLIPHPLGSLAGLMAMGLWGWHWAFIRRVNKVLIVSNSQVQHR